MAKKVTSQDLKKRYESAQADLKKFYDQRKGLNKKIETQEVAVKELKASYLVALATENELSDHDLEQAILTYAPHRNHHHGEKEYHHGG